jgi:MFS family permease
MPPSSTPVSAELPKSRFYTIMGVLLLVEVLSSLETSMIYSALPTIAREFGGMGSVGWLLTAFMLVSAGVAAVGARLGDIFGRQRLLLILVAFCGVGSLISAFAPTMELIILGRAIQGASGAILPLCYGLTRQLAPKGSAPFWIGCLTGAYAFASGLGYFLGGYLSDIGSWRSIFSFTAIYSVLLLPLLLLVPQIPSAAIRRGLDVLGGVLLVPAVAAILYGISVAPKVGWTSPTALGFVVGGAALLAVWAWWEARHDNPLIDVKLLRRREVLIGNVCGALATMGMMQLPLVTMLILQQPVVAGVGLAVTATMAGLLKLPSNVGSLIAAPLSGWMSTRFGSRWALLAGSALGAVAWALFVPFHATVTQVVVVSVLCAFGSSMLLAAIPNTILEGAPLDRSSEVTGLSAVIRGMFGAIGAQTITMLLASSQAKDPLSGSLFPTEQAYDLTFAFVAGTAAAAAAFSLLLIGRRVAIAPATAET